jgi:hypothetical protein
MVEFEKQWDGFARMMFDAVGMNLTPLDRNSGKSMWEAALRWTLRQKIHIIDRDEYDLDVVLAEIIEEELGEYNESI